MRPPPRTARATRLLLAVLALALLVVTGCAVGPSTRPPVATRSEGDAPPALDDAPASEPARPPLLPPLVPPRAMDVVFADCTSEVRSSLAPAALGGRDLSFECGTIPVSGRGSASPAELSVVRVSEGPLPPAGAGPRPPVVAVGEPGGRVGSEEAVRLATSLSPDLLARTAIYGVDLRGTGASEPVDCLTPTTREAITDADPLASTPAALEPLRDAAETAARTCTQLLETALTDYRTGVSAEDLEQVRQALGVPHLHVVGLGDGASVVAEWAQRYPRSVGRTVLDAPPDPTSPTAQRADEQSRATRAALDAFASDCTARPGCALGEDPVATVTELLGRVRAAPLTALDGRTVTDGTLTRALTTGLARPERWDATAAALAAAGRRDPSGVLALLAPREADGGGFDTGLINACNNTAERLTVDQVAAAADRARRADPLFGAFFAQQAMLCTAWPVPTAVPTPPERTGPPPLVLGTEGDVRAPLPATRRVAAGLRNVTLVTWLGAAHGAFPGTPCVESAVGRYLLDGELPRQGTVCPP